MFNRPDGKIVIVIGAGIVGASIAFHLARRGAKVKLLDAGTPGQGASAVSFAWINARDKNPRHYHDLNRRAVDMWDRFARNIGGNASLTWGGELRWVNTVAGAEPFADRVRTLQAWGYAIDLLDEAAVRELEPGLRTGAVSAASFSRVDGHVNTARIIDHCIEQSEALGTEVLVHTRVTGFDLAERSDGARTIQAVHLNGDPVPCDAVVLAGGADAPELAGWAGIELPLKHTFGATMLTDPQPPILKSAAVVHSATDVEAQVVLRQLPDGRVMIHGGNAGKATGSLGRDDNEVEQVMTTARKVMPALKDATVTEVRRGRRPVPEDGQSILGYARIVPNLYLAVTHSGVTLAPLIGEFASTEILDDVRVDLLEPFRLERFEVTST